MHKCTPFSKCAVLSRFFRSSALLDSAAAARLTVSLDTYAARGAPKANEGDWRFVDRKRPSVEGSLPLFRRDCSPWLAMYFLSFSPFFPTPFSLARLFLYFSRSCSFPTFTPFSIPCEHDSPFSCSSFTYDSYLFASLSLDSSVSQPAMRTITRSAIN